MGGRGSSLALNRSLTKSEQLKVILESNPVEDGIHTWIRDEADIVDWRDAINDYRGGWLTPDFTASDIEKALDTGEITVYSSKPIANGYFVTPSKMEAESYAGGGKIYSEKVKISDVAWIDELQGQLARRKK